MAAPPPDPAPASPFGGEALPHALLRAGLLPPDRFLEAVRLVRDDAFWLRWGRNALLALAVGQILAGIGFFFAFNWAELPAFAKLGLIQGGIVLCVAGAWLGRDRRLAWEALLTAAAVLVGVLLAVFGQIYQTGADAYTLFVGWGLLILPWVALSRAVVPWVLWLAVVGVGASAYAVQIAIPMDWIRPEVVAVLLALFYAAALALSELAAWRGVEWLRALWLRRLLVGAILGLTFAVAAPTVFDDAPGWPGALALAALTVAAIGFGLLGRWWRDLPVVVLAVLAASLFLCFAGFRMAIESEDAIAASFVLLAIVGGVFGVGMALLRRVRAGMVGDG